MDAAHVILATIPSAMDAQPTESVKDVSLCTSYTFTRKSPKGEPETQTSSSSKLQPIVKNNKPSMCKQALNLELNHELSADHSAFSLQVRSLPRREHSHYWSRSISHPWNFFRATFEVTDSYVESVWQEAIFQFASHLR